VSLSSASLVELPLAELALIDLHDDSRPADLAQILLLLQEALDDGLARVDVPVSDRLVGKALLGRPLVLIDGLAAAVFVRVIDRVALGHAQQHFRRQLVPLEARPLRQLDVLVASCGIGSARVPCSRAPASSRPCRPGIACYSVEGPLLGTT
jgi:hypothetical protein